MAPTIADDHGSGVARGGPRRHAAVVLVLARLLLASLARGEGGPPGLVSWGHQSRLLAPGEAVTVQVNFANLPLRRFTFLVESSGAVCHLNVRRDLDGGLLHDQRDEVRHEVDVPWGEGESLTAVLTAGAAGGTFDVSFWGPPADAHKRAYSYHVNRALEAHAAGDDQGARDQCRAALQRDSSDEVARLLLRRLDEVARPPASAPADSTGIWRQEATTLIAEGRLYEALAVLDGALAAAPDAATAALVLRDLGDLHRALDNVVQARFSYEAARELGLPPVLDAAVAAALAELPAAER